MNVLDLFSGIGGFSLGLERAGMRTVAFCEIEPFARRVLAKHWPDVPCYTDVRELTADRLRADGISVDVICGGFPCQDISTAGKGAGIGGERSGLWKEYARIIGELQPRYVIVENVAALLGRGLDVVLGDLAALGYDAEWNCIPASAVGAPHRRDRIWIVAHPCGERRSGQGYTETTAHNEKRHTAAPERGRHSISSPVEPERQTLADTSCGGCNWDWSHIPQEGQSKGRDGSAWDGDRHSDEIQHAAYYASISEGIRRGVAVGQWRVEPDVGRVAHGVPAWVDRLRGLGNAVVPQIPEIIGRAILASQKEGDR